MYPHPQLSYHPGGLDFTFLPELLILSLGNLHSFILADYLLVLFDCGDIIEKR